MSIYIDFFLDIDNLGTVIMHLLCSPSCYFTVFKNQLFLTKITYSGLYLKGFSLYDVSGTSAEASHPLHPYSFICIII